MVLPVTDTTTDRTTTWRHVASRATHPSAVSPGIGPDELLVEIAAGIGHVTVPFDLRSTPTTVLSRELVLSTPAYDVWVMSWPEGTEAALHVHDEHVAFHVVSGAVHEDRYVEGGPLRRSIGAGETVLVPPGLAHRLVSREPTTTVHVHAKSG